MLTRLGFDFLAALSLAVTAALGAYTPVYLAQRDKSRGGSGRSITYVLGNLFSAGVMVSAGFCHLLGEALKQMPHMQFPLAPFLCGCGYLLTLCADKAATLVSTGSILDDGVEVIAGVDLAERGTPPPPRTGRGAYKDTEMESLLSRGGSGGGAAGTAGALGLGLKGGSGTRLASDLVDAASAAAAAAGGAGNGAAAGGDWPTAAAAAGGATHRSASSAALQGGRAGSLAALSSSQLPGAGAPPGSFEIDLAAAADASGTGSSLVRSHSRQGNGAAAVHHLHAFHEHDLSHSHSHHGGSHGSGKVSFLTAVLMGVALCFHSLLEGAAMGAQATISNSMHIFIAIVSHKGLAAYALGSSIVDSNASMSRFWSVILPFTFASPVGIFIGFIISDIAQGTGAAAISALASGTFLYVAFMEVIPREMHDPRRPGAKLLALLLGFVLMSILAIWA